MTEPIRDWRCPHPECKDSGREYHDPSTVKGSTCDLGHAVKLVWRDGRVSARMPGRVNRHEWRIHAGGYWFCWRCSDRAGLWARLPVFGCVGSGDDDRN